MAIFKKRPLAAACALLVLSVVGAHYLSVVVTAALIALSALVLTLTVIFCIRRGMTYRRLLIVLMLTGILLGAGGTLLEKKYTESPFAERMGQAADMTLVVETIHSRNAYGSELTVKITEIDGERCYAKALLVTEDMTPFYLGDRLSGRFVCAELAEYLLYQGQETTHWANNVHVALVPEENAPITLAEDGTRSLRTRLSDWRWLLQHRLSSVIGGEAGDLVSALLLGTKASLDDGTVLQFRRVGLSHLLALSGLHLAILAGELELLLRVCRLGKRWRILLLLCCLAFYWVLTGCSFSMLRAILMFAVLQFAFFTKGDYDALTSLFLVGALIVLITPSAVFDLSFQMTMLATLGILAFAELQGALLRVLPRREGVRKWFWMGVRTLLSSLFITFSATLLILPIQWLVFGETSLLTPLANPVMIPLATALLWLSLPLLALCFFPAVATPLGIPAKAIAQVTLLLTERASQLRGMLSLQYGFVAYVFIPLFVLTALLLIVDLKKLRFLTTVPAVLAVLAFAIALSVTNQNTDSIDVIYRTTGTNDGILLAQNGVSVICDTSNGSSTQLGNDYRLLQKSCATEIEVLMLTHYHERQVTALSRFADHVMIRQIWLPTPQRDEDRAILADLLIVAASEGIDVTVYDYDVPLTVFGSGSVTVSTPLYEARSVEAAFELRVSYGETALTYQSAAYGEYARNADLQEREIAEDYLILGGHGPNPHGEIAWIGTRTPREIVVSNEQTLKHLAVTLDTVYVLFPEKVVYRLE